MYMNIFRHNEISQFCKLVIFVSEIYLGTCILPGNLWISCISHVLKKRKPKENNGERLSLNLENGS